MATNIQRRTAAAAEAHHLPAMHMAREVAHLSTPAPPAAELRRVPPARAAAMDPRLPARGGDAWIPAATFTSTTRRRRNDLVYNRTTNIPCFVAAKENMQHALSEQVDYTTEAHLRTHWRLLTYVTKVLSYFTANSPVVFCLSMTRKMKDALETIGELVVEMNTFHFLQHAEAPSVDHPQTHSQVDESDIVGRQEDKEQVVKILLDHSHAKNDNDNCNVMVLPIVGMGGIGKTTLAQLVHNDERVKRHFDLVLWACVSDKFVIEEIIRSVIEVATMNKCALTRIETLQKELCRVLSTASTLHWLPQLAAMGLKCTPASQPLKWKMIHKRRSEGEASF
nr:disease resistance protein RPP8-like [Aegilops tauschii subsp. strangulata]